MVFEVCPVMIREPLPWRFLSIESRVLRANQFEANSFFTVMTPGFNQDLRPLKHAGEIKSFVWAQSAPLRFLSAVPKHCGRGCQVPLGLIFLTVECSGGSAERA